MARKGVFSAITGPRPERNEVKDAVVTHGVSGDVAVTTDTDAPHTPSLPTEKKSHLTGQAVGALQTSLMHMRRASIQDLEPDLIDNEGLQDRLSYSDDDVDDLRQSILTYGQQVPILVRPHPVETGRYQIVYGRRRLRALKMIGMPVKAMVKEMEDQALVLAQGQENSLRKDPSFIEKALFVCDLQAAGYPTEVITDALGIDKTTVYRLGVIANTIPREVIEAIGPAPETGRRRWLEICAAIKDEQKDAHAFLQREFPDGLPRDQTSDGRFVTFLDAFLAKEVTPVTTNDRGHISASRVVSSDGKRLAVIKRTASHLTLKIIASDDKDFMVWMEQNAENNLQLLHQAWKKERSGN